MSAASDPDPELVWLTHNRISLALHRLRADGSAHPLLLLHGLGERTAPALPAWASVWPGAVWGLDFTGHGRSTVPHGGGYTSEMLMADADVALAHLGEVTVLGRGLGAWIALLLAGARPTVVRGAVLADGPGLAGGGTSPGSPSMASPDPAAVAPPDPFALLELARDVRPPDYALSYVRQAVQLSGLDQPVAVAAVVRPTWLQAVVGEPGVLDCPLGEALAHYAS